MLDALKNYTFGTPDFGHSDLFSLNISGKFLLSHALKSGYLLIWSKDIGTGFPILGEGQIGMFNLYNLFAFKFLDPILAFNLGYFVIWLTIFTGSYLYGRVIKLSKLSSLFLATIFSFSGIFVTHVPHFNLLQTASFLPWEFFLIEKYFQSSQKRWLLAFSFVMSQQIYSGFPQLALISLTGIAIYSLRRPVRRLIPVGIFILLGLILASPQLLANIDLVRLSFRQGISVLEMSRFPLHPKHLITLIDPYLLGDPRAGTYPHFSKDWGIFWESTGYLGILPLILAIFSRPKKIYLAILVISFILMLGKFTPLFFLFQIPPLSLFRVPARFLFLFVWIIAILAAISLNKIPFKKISAIIVFIAAVDILRFAAGYNPVINAKEWFAPPETAQILKKDSSWFRIYPIPIADEWNKIFLTRGWKNMDEYLPFQNSLDPNTNLLWQIPSATYYHSGLTTRRQDLWTNIVESGTIINRATNRLEVASSSAKLLSLASVKYLISAHEVENSNFLIFATTSSSPRFFIYQNQKPLPHAYLTRHYLVAASIADLTQKVANATSSAVILEKLIDLIPAIDPIEPVEVTKNSDLEVVVKTNSRHPSLLILTDSYHPSWQASIDGAKTEILPANLNQRAVITPPGDHIIKFTLNPLSPFGL